MALRSIKLVGGVPLSVTAAEAVAAACPQLTSLSLDYAPWTDSSAGADAGRQCDEQDQGAQAAHSSSCLGVQKLLVGVGPRLRELHVTCSAHRWPAEAWGALRHCTGLTALTVEAGWRDGLGSDRPVSHLGERQFYLRCLPVPIRLWAEQHMLTVGTTCAKFVASARLRHVLCTSATSP